jgi:hypothetical protein
VHVERGPDGLELAVVPVPGADTVSLRMLVRAGGADDPPAKGGLAHLVEHLLHQHGAGLDGRALFRDARAVGAVLNAHTSPATTTFELDAPRERFGALAERYLRMVTSPDFGELNVLRELGVVRTEAAYHDTGSLLGYLDMAVFPAPSQAGPLIGTDASRGAIAVDDAIRFFEAHYRPSRTTVVLAGAITPEEARSLIARAYLVPPLPDRAAPEAERPTLPLEQKVQAGVTVTMLGYLLAPGDGDVCATVAPLVELRLIRSVREAGANVSEVAVACPRLRGNDFAVAFAYTNALDAPDLPGDLESVFASLASDPPRAAERARIDARHLAERERIAAEPALLAERVAAHAAARGTAEIAEVLGGPLPTPARLAELVRRSFTAERRVLLHFSPMQN